MENAEKIVVFSAIFERRAVVSSWPEWGREGQPTCDCCLPVKSLSNLNIACSEGGGADGYRPRQPEQTVLYQIMAGHLETFLARQQRDGQYVPRFVEKC